MNPHPQTSIIITLLFELKSQFVSFRDINSRLPKESPTVHIALQIVKHLPESLYENNSTNLQMYI